VVKKQSLREERLVVNSGAGVPVTTSSYLEVKRAIDPGG